MSESKIKILNSLVADQIAAGEVVERPASVVKELLENSLDAGATKVQLEIDGGGMSRLRVVDNGSGLSADDVELAFTRHATSKIATVEDIDMISSFGFRGEALPSIASVSKIVVQTKQADAVAGTRLVIEGGVVKEKRETGCPVGTEFLVEDLFFNTPARKKFLKKATTEASHCAEALSRLALIRPDVSFAMVSNGRKRKTLFQVDNAIERVANFFPNETLAISEKNDGPIKVTAILGPPEQARAGAGSLYSYVNGRFVRDKALLRAVTQAYGGTLDSGRYPVGFIAITMPLGSFDVNVHPQKTEVRFADQGSVFKAVGATIAEMTARSVWSMGSVEEEISQGEWSNNGIGLENGSAVNLPAQVAPGDFSSFDRTVESDDNTQSLSVVDLEQGEVSQAMPMSSADASCEAVAEGEQFYTPQSRERLVPPPKFPVTPTPSRFGLPVGQSPGQLGQMYNQSKTAFERLPTTQQPLPVAGEQLTEKPFSGLKYIGQAHNTYLLLEDQGELVIMDQHAAHERITYEHLREQRAKGQVASQGLLTPHMVDLGPAETDRVMEYAGLLSKLGMEVSAAGPDRVAIRSVPAVLKDANPARLLADMILAIEGGREGSKGETDDLILSKIACHGSIRAGRAVRDEEVFVLLKEMDKIDFAGHCPHGRPVLARFSWSEIGRRVGRS